MGGKYEVRYYISRKEGFRGSEYSSEFTNSFFHFLKLMVTKKVIYFKIICEK